MKLITLLISFLSLTQMAFAADSLSDAGYLRKLSFHLRGAQPDETEYRELSEKRDQAARQEFLARKLSEYLQSEEYRDRMAFRLSERFQIVTPQMGVAKKVGVDPIASYEVSASYDSLTELFRNMAGKNLSWDKLLTGKEYTLSSQVASKRTGFDDIPDFDFYRYLVNEPLPDSRSRFESFTYGGLENRKSVDVKFADDDERIAGSLTTSRFINRYNTTNVNRNRRRAAAVFRIFLCDPMTPSIPPAADRKGSVLEDAFGLEESIPGHANASEERLETILRTKPEDRHGADRQCAACHYKLDPMGRTFQNIGIVLNPMSAPGALIYDRVKNAGVNIKVKGLGGLAREIVKQPEYVNCQIEWLWEQFIGKDVTLSFARRAELAKAFDEVGRRTNDFVSLLVTSPEFRQRPARAEHVQYSQVAPLLKRCDSCHAGAEAIGELSGGKIGKWDLLSMRERLNLPETSKKKMPRNWMEWKPADLQLIKRWIDEGAANIEGKAQLTAQDLGGN